MRRLHLVGLGFLCLLMTGQDYNHPFSPQRSSWGFIDTFDSQTFTEIGSNGGASVSGGTLLATDDDTNYVGIWDGEGASNSADQWCLIETDSTSDMGAVIFGCVFRCLTATCDGTNWASTEFYEVIINDRVSDDSEWKYRDGNDTPDTGSWSTHTNGPDEENTTCLTSAGATPGDWIGLAVEGQSGSTTAYVWWFGSKPAANNRATWDGTNEDSCSMTTSQTVFLNLAGHVGYKMRNSNSDNHFVIESMEFGQDL